MAGAAALVPVLILLATGVAVGVPLDGPQRARRRGAALAWVGLVGAAAGTFRLHGQRLSASSWIQSDSHSQFLSLVLLVGLALTLPVVSALDRHGDPRDGLGPRLYSLLLVSAGGMLLMVSTRNLAVILVALELVSIGFHSVSQTPRAAEREPALGGWLTDLVGRSSRYYRSAIGLASAPAILGAALLCYELGGCDLARMEIVLSATGGGVGPLPGVALGLFLLGLAWRLVAFAVSSVSRGRGAQAMATTFLALAVQVALAGVVLRVTGWLLVLAESWTAVLLVLASVTMFAGSVVAVKQDEIRRRLAFCSLLHVGTVLLGASVGGERGRAAVLFFLLAYGLSSLGAYACLHALRGRGETSPLVRDVRGMGWRYPRLGLAMSLFVLSLVGIPVTFGFMGKFFVFSVAVREGYLAVVLIGLVATVVCAYCYLGVLVALYTEAVPSADAETAPSERPLGLSLLVTAVAVAFAGVFPEPLLSLARRVALGFF